jgi:hypothetical protein
VTIPDKNGAVALHKAARAGHLQMVTELIAAGSPVLPTDSQGNSPLHEVAAGGHVKVLRYLLTALVSDELQLQMHAPWAISCLVPATTISMASCIDRTLHVGGSFSASTKLEVAPAGPKEAQSPLSHRPPLPPTAGRQRRGDRQAGGCDQRPGLDAAALRGGE